MSRPQRSSNARHRRSPTPHEPSPLFRGLLWFVAVLFMPWLLVIAATQGEPATYEPTPAEQLVERHRCWTGRPPSDMKGKRAGHAVVTDAEGRTTYSAANVGPALAHVFKNRHPGLTVHGFCR